jgi:hypothetical protein
MTSDEKAARNAAWSLGHLSWWLRPGQRRIYDTIRGAWSRGHHTLVLHRRFGKSAIGTLISCEQSLRAPGSRILYLCPTVEQGVEVANDQFSALLESCPKSLKPVWVSTRSSWEFPNGSVVRYYGTEKRGRRRIRGLRGEIAIIDEGRDHDAFTDLRASVVGPALQYSRGGAFQLILSTPPDDAESEFFDFARKEIDSGDGTLVSIDDNPDVDAEFRAQAVRDSNGVDTEAYRREYLCQFITASSRLVLPSFPDSAVCTREPLGEAFTALDPGGADLTAVVHGTHGPGGLHATHEWAHSEVTLDEIAQGIRGIESGRPRRWMDQITGGDILRRSLAGEGLPFHQAVYGDPRGAAAILRTCLERGIVTIDPSCTLLLRTLRLAQWEDSVRPSFRRMPRSQIGHCDLLAALLIAVCNSVHVARSLGTVDLLSLRKRRRSAFRAAYGQT